MHRSIEPAAGPLHIIRLPEVVRKTGISRTAVYQRISKGEFPAPVSLGDRAIGFVSEEIDRYIAHLMIRRRVQKTEGWAA